MIGEERAIQILEQRACCRECVVENCTCAECDEAFEMAFKALKQEPKIKVLDRDEVIGKLGTVDIYQANAWVKLIKDLEYLKLKICEVEDPEI